MSWGGHHLQAHLYKLLKPDILFHQLPAHLNFFIHELPVYGTFILQGLILRRWSGWGGQWVLGSVGAAFIGQWAVQALQALQVAGPPHWHRHVATSAACAVLAQAALLRGRVRGAWRWIPVQAAVLVAPSLLWSAARLRILWTAQPLVAGALGAISAAALIWILRQPAGPSIEPREAAPVAVWPSIVAIVLTVLLSVLVPQMLLLPGAMVYGASLAATVLGLCLGSQTWAHALAFGTGTVGCVVGLAYFRRLSGAPAEAVLLMLFISWRMSLLVPSHAVLAWRSFEALRRRLRLDVFLAVMAAGLYAGSWVNYALLLQVGLLKSPLDGQKERRRTMQLNRDGKTVKDAVKQVADCARAHAAARPDEGYPADQAAMGPAGDRCLDQELAGGTKDGLSVRYLPALRAADGRVPSFLVSAEPPPREGGRREDRRWFIPLTMDETTGQALEFLGGRNFPAPSSGEPRAQAMMMRIKYCALEHAARHPGEGYPADLASMGPGGGGCLDGKLFLSLAKDHASTSGYAVSYAAPQGPDGRRGEFAACLRSTDPAASLIVMTNGHIEMGGRLPDTLAMPSLPVEVITESSRAMKSPPPSRWMFQAPIQSLWGTEVGPDGSVLFGNWDGYFLRDPQGRDVWTTKDVRDRKFALGADGTLYILGERSIDVVGGDGRPRESVKLSTPTFGDFFVGKERFYVRGINASNRFALTALDRRGRRLWQYTDASSGYTDGDVLTESEGGDVAVAAGALVHVVGPDGTLKLKKDPLLQGCHHVAFGGGGTLYVAGSLSVMSSRTPTGAVALAPDGRELWRTRLSARRIAVGPDGSAHLGLNAFRADGRLTRLSLPLPEQGRHGGLTGDAVLDADGTLYVLDKADLYAVAPGGEVLWKIPMGGTLADGSRLLLRGRRLYLTARSNVFVVDLAPAGR